jgi:hypothetical protein
VKVAGIGHLVDRAWADGPGAWLLWTLPWLGALAAFLVTYRAPVTYTRSDPHLSLFAAQALVQQGTLRLDAYRELIDEELDTYAVRERDGHLYYYFPPGPSLFAAPTVWLANRAGRDMTITAHNQALQKQLASLICGLVFLLVYGTGRVYLPALPALAITTVNVFGSALVSSLGTALWNMNFAVLFILLAMWLLVAGAPRLRPWQGFVLGGLLFCAFLSRPTTLTFTGPVLVLLLLRDRRAFFRTAAAVGLLLAVFALSSWLAFGRLLPDYYAAERVDRSYQVGRIFVAHLLSPSRGLLIFSPFVVVILAATFAYRRTLSRRPLFWLAVVWLALHLALLSRIGHWYGGHAYGPRLLADALPAIILLNILAWREGAFSAGSRSGRLALGAFLLAGLAAVLINSGQGLYNPSTQRWNDYPNVDQYPEYLFDWRYPQFLASPESLERRYLEHLQRTEPNESGAEAVAEVLQLFRRGRLSQAVPEVQVIGQAEGRAAQPGGQTDPLHPG